MAKKRGPNEGTIFKRKDGRWSAIITVGYENGRRKRKTYYGETREEVRDKLTDSLADKKNGVPIPTGRVTLGGFLDYWLKDCIEPHKRVRTFLSYKEQVERIKLDLGHIQLRKLTGQRVQSFLNALSAKGLSPRTVAYNRVVLRAALKQACFWKMVPNNVAAEGITTPTATKHKVEPVSIEHANALLKAVAGDRLGPLFTLMLYSGLRRGEALGLTWTDIDRLSDIDECTLTVRQTLQRIAGELVLGEPKTEESKRTIELPPEAVTALRETRSRQLEERMRLGGAWIDNGLIFTTECGTPLDPRNVKRVFDRLLKSAGLPHMRLHDLRHATATLMLAGGEAMKTISTVLGHSKTHTTEDIYAHVGKSLQRDAMNRLSKTIGAK